MLNKYIYFINNIINYDILLLGGSIMENDELSLEELEHVEEGTGLKYD